MSLIKEIQKDLFDSKKGEILFVKLFWDKYKTESIRIFENHIFQIKKEQLETSFFKFKIQKNKKFKIIFENIKNKELNSFDYFYFEIKSEFNFVNLYSDNDTPDYLYFDYEINKFGSVYHTETFGINPIPYIVKDIIQIE